MDIKELKGLMEAYSEVYVPQQLDEISQKTATRAFARRATGEFEYDTNPSDYTKSGKSKADETKRRIEKKFGKKAGAHAERAAHSSIFGRKGAGGMPSVKEELDIFDVVLEFLQVEGYAETLEEAEWIMANLIDEEAVDIILGEAIYSEKGKAKAAQMIANRSTPSGRAKSGQGANVAQIRQIRGSGRGDFDREGLGGTPMTPTMAKNPIKKQNYTGTGNKAARRAGTYKEAFEEWIDEAMSNYEKNRKRAAQRAAARNEARKQGKTGAVPGVGYVTPRREKETWTDEKGQTRHAKGL